MRRTFKVLFLLAIVSGCKIAPLSYVSVDPYAKPFQNRIRIPLNIVLSEDVRDSFIVEGVGMKKMAVTEFRRSSADAFVKVFQKNFSEVNIVDKAEDSGLVLIIYRLRPYWSRIGSSISTSPNGVDGYNTITTSYISAVFQFESSLLLNGKKIANGDGKSFSEGQMVSVGQAHKVFEDGLKVAIEAIERSIFTDEVVIKVNESSLTTTH